MKYQASKMFTIDKFYNYMEALASAHKGIRHSSRDVRFYKKGIEEILTGRLQDVGSGDVVMVMEDLEFGLNAQDSDRPKRIRRGAMLLLISTPNLDYSEILKVQTKCEQIGDEIIRKMYQDIEAQEGDLFEDGLLEFDESMVEAMTVGPLLTNCYGMRYQFNLVDEIDLLQEDDVWL